MWSRISSALKPREGNDSDLDHSDAQSTSSHSQPDPFRADATTYYHQSPPTPPSGTHSRTASREEDMIWSLRTQLALQQEMCAQFEVDLGARDELVKALTTRLEASEHENDKRKHVVRSWKKKAADLEKMCRHLEEAVDVSRQESVERSIMDEASGEALRQLHRQISQLEREKKDVEAERDALAQTVGNAEIEMTRLKDRLDVDEAGRRIVDQLQDELSRLEQEKNNAESERSSLAQVLEKAEKEISKLQEELSVTDEASLEALRQLQSQISQLEQDKADLQDAVTQARDKADSGALELREELDNVKEIHNKALRNLQEQITLLEREKSDLDAEHTTSEQAKEKAEAEVVALKEELKTSNDANREALCRLHDHISQLERDKSEVKADRNGLAQSMERMEGNLLRLNEELSLTNEASREAQQRLHDQVLQLERAKADVEAERDNSTSEIARLRSHVQQLQKNSAAMEVTIVQLNKQLDQDKEDIGGLNIALESKQQELELVKRKHGVRGTVGPNPARTNSAPSAAGRAAQPSTVLRTSTVGPRTSSPGLSRVPSTLGRAANTKPPVSSALRRASGSSGESKAKLPNRRLSVTSTPSETDEKENTATPVPTKHSRRSMILA